MDKFKNITGGLTSDQLAALKGRKVDHESLKMPLNTGQYNTSKQHEANIEIIEQNKAEEKQRELEFRNSVVNALQGIEKNTALLTEMTILLQRSNDKQDEMFQLMVEILEIMKSKNQEEADNKVTTVTQKITAFTNNANTVLSLCGMVNTVYNAFQASQGIPPLTPI